MHFLSPANSAGSPLFFFNVIAKLGGVGYVGWVGAIRSALLVVFFFTSFLFTFQSKIFYPQILRPLGYPIQTDPTHILLTKWTMDDSCARLCPINSARSPMFFFFFKKEQNLVGLVNVG